MQSHVVSLSEVDDSLADRWRALEDRVEVGNPFYSKDYLEASARHLPGARKLRLLIGQGDDGLDWLIPVVPSARLGRLPVVPGLRNRWPHIFFGQPLVAPGQEHAAVLHLLRHLSQDRGTFWMRLQHLDADHPFTRALLAEAPHSAVHLQRYGRGFAARRPAPTYLEGHSNLRRLERQRRAFERKTGRSVELVDRSHDPAAIEDFLALEAAGWKGRDGGAFLSQSWDAEFLRSVGTAFRQRGRLRLWSLMSGDRTLAMKLNLLARDTVFCFLIAFDEKVAALSPGLQLEVENFRLFHADTDMSGMDSCAAPDNGFANRLYPEQRSLVDVTVGSGLLGRTVTAAAALSGRS